MMSGDITFIPPRALWTTKSSSSVKNWKPTRPIPRIFGLFTAWDTSSSIRSLPENSFATGVDRLKAAGQNGGGETGGDADAYDPAAIPPHRLLWVDCAQFDRDPHQPAETNSPGTRVGSAPLHRHF